MQDLFQRQRAAFARAPYPSRDQRDALLGTLERMLRDNATLLAEAISRDFGHRAVQETQLLELFPTLQGIRHARKHLKRWMAPRRRGVSLWFQPGRAEVVAQPLGVVGIIVPWNYPVSLAIEPLAAALAAGNRAMVKMSEITPATSALLADIVSRAFKPEEVTVVQGDADVAKAFAKLPFDHLLFTGSTRVGASVMAAASERLTPVTLELGGKSPVILGPDYPIEHAVARILAGKCLNAGQTCIAPDYVLLPIERVSSFIYQAKRDFAASYPDWQNTPDYTAVVNERHFARLSGYVEEAQANGARVEQLGEGRPNALTRKFPPTLILNAKDDIRIMQDEIFGPLLPLIPYASLDEAIAYVNARPRPLSLYVFDRDSSRVERILRETISGGVSVNDTLLHYAQPSLPFGGVGPSGMGRYHGVEGFNTFSNLKGVFRQSRINGIGMFKPPYGKRFATMIQQLLR